VKEGYFNEEQVEEDFPGMLAEERARYEAVDSSAASVLEKKGYTPNPVVTYQGLPTYQIKLEDLVPARSAIYCRRKAAYRYWIREAHSQMMAATPLICYLQTDGMIRVKYGCLLYWVAKETKICNSYPCVFPGGPEVTDNLYQQMLEDIKMNEVGFC
jgi:hypothetical protein